MVPSPPAAITRSAESANTSSDTCWPTAERCTVPRASRSACRAASPTRECRRTPRRSRVRGAPPRRRSRSGSCRHSAACSAIAPAGGGATILARRRTVQQVIPDPQSAFARAQLELLGEIWTERGHAPARSREREGRDAVPVRGAPRRHRRGCRPVPSRSSSARAPYPRGHARPPRVEAARRTACVALERRRPAARRDPGCPPRRPGGGRRRLLRSRHRTLRVHRRVPDRAGTCCDSQCRHCPYVE